MKKLKNMLILVCVLAALIICYIVIKEVRERKEAGATDPEDTVIMLAEYKSSDVTKVEYTYNGETVSIEKGTNSYYLTSDHSFPLDQKIAGSMAAAIASVGVDRLVEESDEHFADYGLDEPAYIITATYSGGTVMTFNIGDYNSFTGSYYLNVKGTDKVYLVDGALLGYFKYKLYDLVTDDVIPDFDSDAIKKIAVTLSDGESYELVYDPEAETWTKTYIASGASEEISEDEAVTLYDEATGVPFTDCVAYGIDEENELSQFGLSDAYASIKITYIEEKEATVDTSTSATTTVKVEKTLEIFIGDRVPAEEDTDTDETADTSAAETDAAETEDEDNEETVYYRYFRLGNSKLVYTVAESRIESILGIAEDESAETTADTTAGND